MPKSRHQAAVLERLLPGPELCLQGCNAMQTERHTKRACPWMQPSRPSSAGGPSATHLDACSSQLVCQRMQNLQAVQQHRLISCCNLLP